ncbi:MAG TPA: hypothetical protein VFW19_17695 [Allosphingosinicella sp.]|nr:hypothetical protein [Allosphingosinicella sp.]
MGKYDPLRRHLETRHGAEIEVSFADIETVIDAPLPKAAARPGWWTNGSDATRGQTHSRAWTEAGFNASLVAGAERVRFLRHGYRVVSRSADVTYVEKENPTDEEIARARQAWENLIRLIARTAAKASIKLGIEFDMDDPQVARDVMKATFDGLFLPPPAKKRRGGKAAISD